MKSRETNVGEIRNTYRISNDKISRELLFLDGMD
jgi:hypothetical protein